MSQVTSLSAELQRNCRYMIQGHLQKAPSFKWFSKCLKKVFVNAFESFANTGYKNRRRGQTLQSLQVKFELLPSVS